MHDNVEIIVFDEFNGQLSFELIKMICDGYVKLNYKGGTFFLRQELTVVICSNRMPDELEGSWKNVRLVDGFYERFKYIDIN